MTKAYNGLARVYDYLMTGIDYAGWADYLEKLFDYFAITPCKHIIDLACGTGNSTLPWARRGYEVCGVDISSEMLSVARRKARKHNMPVQFFQQDLRRLSLPRRGDVAVLYQDGLNYLLSPAELRQALLCISDCVRPGGYFIFNLNEVDKLPSGPVPRISYLDEPEMTLVWESAYEEEQRTWQIRLIAFLREPGGTYCKVTEEHRERSYSREELKPLLVETGWHLKACLKAFTLDEPSPADRNIFYVIRRGD